MDDRGLDVRSVANYILAERERFELNTTQLELHKLLYFCHGSFMVKYGSRLVDGHFEAWDHGPVHPLIYREFKDFKAEPIRRKCIGTNLVTGDSVVIAQPKDPITKSHITEVVLQLRHLTASQLRRKSHAKGSPWHSTRESANINLASSPMIPDNLIKERHSRHFVQLVDFIEAEDGIQDYPFGRD